MPASGAPLVGAVLGVGIQLYVNAVRKLPLGRTPWMHVLWAGAGASFGTWLVDFEDRTQKDLEEMLKKRDAANQRLQQQ